MDLKFGAGIGMILGALGTDFSPPAPVVLLGGRLGIIAARIAPPPPTTRRPTVIFFTFEGDVFSFSRTLKTAAEVRGGEPVTTNFALSISLVENFLGDGVRLILVPRSNAEGNPQCSVSWTGRPSSSANDIGWFGTIFTVPLSSSRTPARFHLGRVFRCSSVCSTDRSSGESLIRSIRESGEGTTGAYGLFFSRCCAVVNDTGVLGTGADRAEVGAMDDSGGILFASMVVAA